MPLRVSGNRRIDSPRCDRVTRPSCTLPTSSRTIPRSVKVRPRYDCPASRTRRRVLEAGQSYRGLTFTDRGIVLLDVGSVQDGRVTLSQRGLSMRLLPETLSGIHRAWQDGDITLDGKDDWECSTFSPEVADADEVRCVCSSEDQMLIINKISQAVVSVTREQLNLVVGRIVDPWLDTQSDTRR